MGLSDDAVQCKFVCKVVWVYEWTMDVCVEWQNLSSVLGMYLCMFVGR